MAGTKAGGQAAARTIKATYGPGFFAEIGAKGGKNGTTGGFYVMSQTDPELHRQVSAKGGKISKRPSRRPIT